MAARRAPPDMIPPWSWADGARLIPVDPRAEESLAGQAIVCAGDAARLSSSLTTYDFHDGRCWEVIDVAALLPAEVSDGDAEWAEAIEHGDFMLVVHNAQARTQAIADATGLHLSWLRQLVTGRSAAPVETFMDRLAEVGCARRRNARLLAQLEDEGVDVALITEADARRADRRGALLAVCEAFGRLLYGTGTDADVVLALIELGVLHGVDGDETSAAITSPAQTETETPWT